MKVNRGTLTVVQGASPSSAQRAPSSPMQPEQNTWWAVLNAHLTLDSEQKVSDAFRSARQGSSFAFLRSTSQGDEHVIVRKTTLGTARVMDDDALSELAQFSTLDLLQMFGETKEFRIPAREIKV